MRLVSDSIVDGQPIPSRLAFCRPDPQTRAGMSDNRNPELSWDDLPPGTKSLVLLCHDPDVPSEADDVNQEGRTVPAALPRIDFFHWVLVDIPANVSTITEGEESNGVTPRGKSQISAIRGARRGLNNYTDWFAQDAEMSGKYFGYDGPCPPWNDSIRHRYLFTLYALDIERCSVDGDFGGPEVLSAIQGHILGQASLMGTYSLNPKVPA